mgnify:CR=1 FL=1
MPDIPESLIDLDDDALAQLGTQLQAVGAAAAQIVDGDTASAEDKATAAERVLVAADAFQNVLEEQGRREAERQELSARVAEAQAILNQAAVGTDDASPADATDTGEDEVADPGDKDDTADGSDTTTAAVEVAQPEPTPPESQEASVTNDDESATGGDLDLSELPDPTAALAVAAGQAPPPATVPATPKRSRAARRTPVFTQEAAPFIDLGAVDNTAKGGQLDKRGLAKAIASKWHHLNKMASFAPVPIATAHVEHDVNLTGNPVEDTRIMREQRAEFQAMVASGGNCAIPMNNYDVFNAAQPIGPIGSFVRTVGAEARGAMRYLAAPSWAAAQGGVQVTTNDEDAEGYTNQADPPGDGTTTPKVCIHFDCPEEVTCIVDAVSACASFGNLTYRTSPELVEVLLEQLATAQEQAKEISYLDTLAAGSTQITDDLNPYGAVRSSVWTLANALFAYRKRNHIPLSVPIDVLAPDTMVPVLKADAVADLHLGMSFLGVDQETLAMELFDALNANVAFYFDHESADGTAQSMQNEQGPGSIGNFPLTFKVFFYAPGTWVRLDGGTLNIGLTRDSTLNSQNNLQIWSEEFTVLCMTGAESVEIELTLCPSGAGPDPVEALTCAS